MAAKRILWSRTRRRSRTYWRWCCGAIAVDTAGTLAQARRQLRSLRYALVNSDLRLPDGDGLEIVDRAAELGARTSILSGYVRQLSPEAGDRHEVLMKPMRPSEFVAAVHRLIGPANE
jgi:DNA-binding response OmpR family regulator